jgi:F0F1-type ATP synthase assembly protein I
MNSAEISSLKMGAQPWYITLILLGFIIGIFAIMKPKKD